MVLSVADMEPSDERNVDRAAHVCFFLSAQWGYGEVKLVRLVEANYFGSDDQGKFTY
jgi:hypothetical protein